MSGRSASGLTRQDDLGTRSARQGSRARCPECGGFVSLVREELGEANGVNLAIVCVNGHRVAERPLVVGSKRQAELDAIPHQPRRPRCKILSCGDQVDSLGFCRRHYNQIGRLERETAEGQGYAAGEIVSLGADMTLGSGRVLAQNSPVTVRGVRRDVSPLVYIVEGSVDPLGQVFLLVASPDLSPLPSPVQEVSC